MSQRRIQVFDTTLRDGEQSPGIALQPYEKAEIAEQLERLGVDVIEAGFAGASPGRSRRRPRSRRSRRPADRRVAGAVRAGRTSTPQPRRLRAPAARASTSFSRPARSTWRRSSASSPHEVLEKARWSVAYAASVVDEVEFSCEDATRSDPAFVAQVCRVAIEAGRDDHQPARHGRLRAPGGIRRLPRRRSQPLPGDPRRHALRALPQRPRSCRGELARRNPGRRRAGRVHRERNW